jgi:membrane protein
MAGKRILSMCKAAVAAWIEDYAASMGAALAYYTLFSLAPLLLIAIAIAGLVFGQDAARGEIVAQLRDLMGDDGASAVQALLQNVSEPGKGIVATVIGGATLLIGAMSVFGELQDALDRIWRVPVPPGGSSWKRLLRTRLLSFGMVIAIGFLLLTSLLVSAAIGALETWWAPAFGGWQVLAHVADLVFGYAVVTLAFALIYKVVPRVPIEWHDVWVGALVTAGLFVIGKFAIGTWLGHAGFASGFGAAASVVVLLAWIYYSAQIFLLGAEFTQVYARSCGSHHPEAAAARAADAASASAPVAAVAASRAALAEAMGRKSRG